MASILQDLELVEVALGDLAAFAAGSPISASPTIGGEKVSVAVVHLPNGPAAPYQVISGSVLAILGTALAIGATFSAGEPVQVATKEGNTWYGLTVQKAPPAA